MDVDPQFRQSRAAAKRRRMQRRLAWAAIGGGGLTITGLIGAGIIWLFSGPDDAPIAATTDDDDAEQITQVETAGAPPATRLSTPFVDIPGDPMILRFAASTTSKQRNTSDTSLDPARFGPARPDQLALLIEDLVVRESRLMTSLPSSREDFAFFQAQRSRSLDLDPSLAAAVSQPVGDGQTVTVEDEDNSWGEALGEESNDSVTYVETQIENTTSVAFVRPEAEREKIFEDLVVRFVAPRELTDFLTDNDVTPDIAQSIADAAAETMPELAAIQTENGLPVGTIVALRQQQINRQLTPLQVTIYGPEGRIGALARNGLLGYIRSGDPWVQEDLSQLVAQSGSTEGEVRDYRLLDAIYSAVIRNGVPTELVGELIAILSQAYDLEAVAAPGDSVTLLYAPNRGDGLEQIAYVAISGPSGSMPCYVAKSVGQGGQASEYACFTKTGQMGGNGGLGFLTPVNGTLSSRYGPRFHPVLKEVRLHGGVDWAAPTGTPIVAALDGTFAKVGNGGGYGKVVYIDHANGLQSRYAHMDRFAPTSVVGQRVRAGEVIGYVGTTGRSTGPHLHFELRRDNEPFDPFTFVTGGMTASAAVEALTDQIIKVESAGNANAKNPLSTATGLGQFIESTWLRMMREYEPSLYRTMLRGELLALRTDPTLSRRMVQNLARENENFLRARGHRIDAGRLYLAHFLGPGGAHTVLSSADELTVRAVMGAAVVNANPFLRNYTIADLKSWAQRKMRGAGSSGASTPRPPAMTPEIRTYIEAIDALLGEEI
ncbi:M23 family metallopeptidase [Yoonia sp. 2307UL14-13]|uniref:M23 family metallopeptidase n=1 Tax=Yoonia sp. 2307UL14-13 TaxID=3126506 RepID=UPI0030AF57F2